MWPFTWKIIKIVLLIVHCSRINKHLRNIPELVLINTIGLQKVIGTSLKS